MERSYSVRGQWETLNQTKKQKVTLKQTTTKKTFLTGVEGVTNMRESGANVWPYDGELWNEGRRICSDVNACAWGSNSRYMYLLQSDIAAVKYNN